MEGDQDEYETNISTAGQYMHESTTGAASAKEDRSFEGLPNSSQMD